MIPEANRGFIAERLKSPPEWPVGLNDGESAEVAGFRFHAVPAAHEQVDRDGSGRCLYLGYVIETGGYRIYHSGDCMLYDGIAGPHQTVLRWTWLCCRSTARRRSGGWRAISTGAKRHGWRRRSGAKLAVPMHYDMFTFNTATPDEFVSEGRRLGVRTRVLRAGERLELGV